MSNQPRKFIIGLTGNIATGKSAVLRMAAEKGALTLDADKIVHQILDNDPSMQAAIAVAFGEQLRRKDGSIDRAALAAIVFDDAEALRDLEHLLHPAVGRHIVRQIGATEATIVMIEAIKLLEGDLAAMCDQIWVTRCPRALQEQRLTICRGLDAAEARRRIEAQNPQEAKVARADVVIDTDGPLAKTREQVERAWRQTPGAHDGQEAVEAVSAAPAEKSPREAEVAARPAPEARIEAPVSMEAPSEDGVLVRRARPSDIPALLLLMQRASGGHLKLTRAELLASFSERSYLIGQIETEVVSVMGWNTDSTTAVCVDQILAQPIEAIATVGPAMLREIEQSAQELICEVVLVFLAPDAPEPFRELLYGAGYEQMTPAYMRRAWRQIVEERRPQGAVIMGKVLRDIRVA